MARLRIVLLALFLAACAAGPEQVSVDTPHATLEFEKGYTTGANAVEATVQEYSLSTDGQCGSREETATFTWVTGAAMRRRAAADQKLYVSAVTTYYASGMRVAGTCSAWATFTPEVGHTYRVVQREQRLGVCEVEVVDQQLGRAPADLVIYNSGCPLPVRLQ